MKSFIFHINDTDDCVVIARELICMANVVLTEGTSMGTLNHGWKRNNKYFPGFAEFTKNESVKETLEEKI